MTCKSSFYRSMLENLKRRLRLPAIILLYYFFACPVASGLTLSASSAFGYSTSAEMAERLREVFTQKTGAPEFVMSVLFAVICAMQSFSYLHKKNRVDMYHSLPVSKRRNYTITCFNGLLIYIVPYAVNLLLTYLVGAAFRAVTFDSIRYGLHNFIYAVLLYAMVYFTTVIAVMLTGNGGVSFVVAWILLLYEPVIRAVTEIMRSAFFHTYVESEEYVALTPLAIYAQSDIMKRLFGNSPTVTAATIMADYGQMLLSAAAACLIGYLLYYKRPSESCGKALAFQKSKILFKFLLVIPFAVIMAVAFYGISKYSFIAAIFGLTIGVAIAHFVLEVIYEFDIRSILKHKLQLPVLFAVACFAYCTFQFDLFGYDSYVPRVASVKSAYIDLHGTDSETDHFYEDGKYCARK